MSPSSRPRRAGRGLRIATQLSASVLALLGAGSVRTASAESLETAAALFQQGKQLLSEHQYEQACPILARSADLDANTAALLALAICFEGAEKFASARAAYATVVQRAKHDGRSDRELVASERHAFLGTKVSSLRLEPAAGAQVSDLTVTLDGRTVSPDIWVDAVEVDGGEHVLDVFRDGAVISSQHVVLARQGDRRVVDLVLAANEAQPQISSVREVRDEGEPTPAASPASTTAAAAASGSAESRRGNRSWVGVGLGSAGLALLGMGSAFGVRALAKNDESSAGCRDDACLPAAKQARNEARFAGDVATVTLALGVLATTAGVTLWLTDRPRKAPGPRASSSWQPTLALQRGLVSGGFGGTF